MPRPKRPKIVHTVPILRGARPESTSSNRKQLTKVSPTSSGRVTEATDDSDGLVTTQRTVVGAARPAARNDYIMTGALGEEETRGTRLQPPSTRTIENVTRTAREAEYAGIAGDRGKARDAAAAHLRDQGQIPSTSQPEIGTRPASRAGPSAIQSRRPSMVSRGQRTPLAQSSTLGAALFKKRPRQPSLLQMVQSHQAQSDLDHNEDLDEFRPDDESTPLIKPFSQSQLLGTASSSRRTSSSRKRKLAPPEVQVVASQPENIPSSPSAAFSQPLELEDSSDVGTESENPEPVLPSPQTSQALPSETFSDTLAPPQSSSSPPQRNQRTKSRKASVPSPSAPKTRKQHQSLHHHSAHSSDATAITPSSPARQPLQPLTTAHLQNLLPRRRTRHRPPKGAYDLPSSSDIELNTTHLSENEDELSFQAASKLRRKPKSPARTLPPSKKSAGTKTKPVPVAAEKGKRRLTKTYARKSLPDSDVGSGEEDEDDSLGPVRLKGKRRGKGDGDGDFDEKAKKEMQRLAEKFAEVDEFTLDFEDVTGSSSQMADAR